MNIAQDINGDIDIVDGQLVLVGNQFGSQGREIEEHIEQRLRTVLGEHFLDKTIGLPWFDDIFTKNPNIPVVEATVINEILNTPGVIRILEFNTDFNKGIRQLFFPLLKIQYTDDVIEFENLLEEGV